MFSKISVAILTSLLLQGCGDSSDSSGLAEGPATTGVYALTTQELAYTCTDGDIGKSEPIAVNIDVTIENNEIKFKPTASSQEALDKKAAASGLEGKSSGYSGIIEADNSFVATQTATATSADVGTFTVSYSITGTITDKSWSGSYKFTTSYPSLNVVCNEETTFSGARQ